MRSRSTAKLPQALHRGLSAPQSGVRQGEQPVATGNGCRSCVEYDPDLVADSLVSTRGFAGFDGSDIARGGPARPDLERRPLHGGGLDFGDSTAVYDLDTGALAATMVEVSTSSVTLLVDFSKVLEVA